MKSKNKLLEELIYDETEEFERLIHKIRKVVRIKKD